ncbi:DUF294 nucleotidyltransferase-like domain-containing protein [Moraxella sp. FZLJ2107]|uniref:DUF294 nucleotidyltransferase-like domain-containing protein n=1 Tax=unclassified Moraxella TaxID=2685852 RepID=UPI0020C891B9|nr:MULTISPECIES: DUF294 nucleotidyltransferase-like domain-containing protein [unclassified Moraxella]UTO05820.1 DUF294 nucleotidyltransferase-like domain-containing protein [Moraxella sp. FZLJ2107]UTO22556.1 DUF294 nucleotidyltransferase-like domain-containing protein [Moraxella sp. FZLJ2109]
MNRFDFSTAPYNALTTRQRTKLEKATDIVFFDDHATVISPQDAVETLYIIIKGIVQEVDADGEVLAIYHPSDSFDTRALFEQSYRHSFIAAEQSLLYAIPKAVIRELIEKNSEFGAYFFANIADKLKAQTGNKRENELAGLFTAKIKDAYRPYDELHSGEISLIQAGKIMQENKSKSLLIHHNGKIGLVAESLFRDVMIQSGDTLDPHAPIHQWACFELISADVDDFMFTALLKMMNHRIQRVVVTKNGDPIGMLEQIDILAFLSNHSHLIAEKLEVATSLGELTRVATQMNATIAALFSNGMQAKQLAQLMQVLNARLFEKAWRLIAPEHIIDKSCLIVMGSEGRGEQVLKTDQDNALIFDDDLTLEEVMPYTQAFSAVLDDFGYPPCQGKIMVNNPTWCKPISEFKQMVGSWCRTASGENMMNLAIFIDAKPITGKQELFYEVKNHLQFYLQNDVGMLMGFARVVNQFNEDGQGFFAQILGQEKRKMDIKKMGTFPIVHGVRSLSLQARITETNTFERINKLAEMGIIEKQLSQDVAEALAYLMHTRLKNGLFSIKHGLEVQPNQVATENLSTLERDLLKDALQVVKRFKHMVNAHFHLSN